MDESDSKIKVSSFFERVDSIDKVANSALSKSKGNFDIINNQKALVNSINVSIEALETKVRDIANFIIIEKKMRKTLRKIDFLNNKMSLRKLRC